MDIMVGDAKDSTAERPTIQAAKKRKVRVAVFWSDHSACERNQFCAEFRPFFLSVDLAHFHHNLEVPSELLTLPFSLGKAGWLIHLGFRP